MKMTLQQFLNCQTALPVIIHSIDMVGYQAAVIMDGEERRLVCNDGKPLRHQSLMHMREALQPMPVASLTLQHQSAYDEMINQPQRSHRNTLALPLSLELYPGVEPY
jgi:hypothetical protein